LGLLGVGSGVVGLARQRGFYPKGKNDLWQRGFYPKGKKLSRMIYGKGVSIQRA
jgi:hypothetical protein